MYQTFFECKAQFDKTMENGLVKRVTESYLTEAGSVGEAEKIFVEQLTPYMTGDFDVSSVVKKKYVDVFRQDENDCADKWYKARLRFITLDEKSGKEKETKADYLIQASDFYDAYRQLNEGMKGSMMDYSIVSLIETAYMDVFFYGE